MWLRRWTVKIGITILLGLTPAFIQWLSPKSHTQDIFNWRRVLQTHVWVFVLNLVCSHHWLNMPYFYHISCSLRQEIILLQSWQQKTSESKLGVLLPIMSMAVTWHRLRVGPSDMYLTVKASFKDTLFKGMHQGEFPPCMCVCLHSCVYCGIVQYLQWGE